MFKSLRLLGIGIALLTCIVVVGCDGRADSNQQQAQQQERLNREATAQTGMPAITNFFERKTLKQIYELRDQTGYVTYTYVENMMPTVHHGSGPGATILGGKFTFVGTSIGYGIPYSTQYTAPESFQQPYSGGEYHLAPQEDPNGLFSPSSAAGTWVLMMDPSNPKGEVKPVYMEPNVFVSPSKYPFD